MTRSSDRSERSDHRFYSNKAHTSRSFHSSFGMSPSGYHASIRMREACRLIREHLASPKEAARCLGFSHFLTFHRTFKKLVGRTPGAFRKDPGGLLW